jgi:hypothetical protein
MAVNKPKRGKKYYTPAEANAALPLVRAIVRDITALAESLRERHDRLARLSPREREGLDGPHREEVEKILAEFEHDQDQMRQYTQELVDLGIELKDYFIGLIDFPCWMDGREVYLCWKMGEPEVGHWHETNAGFAGRRKLMVDAPAR